MLKLKESCIHLVIYDLLTYLILKFNRENNMTEQDLKAFHQQAVRTHIDLILALEKFMLLYGSLEDTSIGQAVSELKDEATINLNFHRSHT